MTAPADVINLRWLVERAVPLKVPPAKKRGHLLGLGLPARKSYPHPQGPVPLPTFEDALANVRARVGERVRDLDADQSAAAWAAMTGHPGAVVPLLISDADPMLQFGTISDAALQAGLVRRVGLAVVGKPPAEQIKDGALLGQRVAGVARLTVLFREDGRSAIDAWLDGQWVGSTSGLVGQLERLQREVITPKSTSRRSALCVIAADFEEVITPSIVKNLGVSANVHGLDLTIARRASTSFGHVISMVRQRSPSYMIFIGASSPEADRLIEVHDRATQDGRRLLIQPQNAADAMILVRDALTHFSDVSGALHSVAYLAETALVTPRALMPIVSPGRCLHDSAQRAYIEDESSQLWWSHDTAGHGGSKFKTYKLVNHTLVHEACRDADGSVIPKHKSPIGAQVRLADLHACSGPAHL